MNNLKKFYFHKALISFDLWLPIWVIYLLNRDISMAEVAIADGFYRGISAIMEVPAGKISDKVGAKNTLVIAAICYALAIITLGLTTNFAMLLLSWFLWAITTSFNSGADQSFLYELSGKNKFKVNLSNMFSIALVCSSIGAVSASYIFGSFASLPFIINFILAVIAIVPLIMIKIDRPSGKKQKDIGFKEYFQSIGFPDLKWIIIGAFSMTCFWAPTLFYQPYFKQLNINVELFGYIYVACQIIGALGTKISNRISNLTSIAICGTLTIALGLFFFQTNSYLGILGILLTWLGFYFMETTVSERILAYTDNRARATALSIKNLIAGLLLLAIRTYTGHLSDTAGLNQGVKELVYILLFFLVMMLVLVFYKRKPTEEVP